VGAAPVNQKCPLKPKSGLNGPPAHTIRSATTKLLVGAAILAFFFPGHASAESRLNVVIAVDLSKSVAVRGPDQATEFEKNIAAVARLLAQLPAGANVTVIGITDHSFTEPYVLLAALLPGDPGYFGERLQHARNQLVQEWQHRSARLEPRFPHTDILGALLLASQIFDEHHDGGTRELILFSDMRQSTSDLDLESPSVVPDFVRLQKQGKFLVTNLRGVVVYALGVDGAGKSTSYWHSLREFWVQYLRGAGADLACYSVLRERLQFANTPK
jgi:hypothetical protein